MSAEIAEEEEKQPHEVPQCGRLVFRGVELAYLNMDGEYMMPLAELLALVLPATPRTTLFTRMEKMKVRRHFCKPDEIKLLKTVNGIHGSSANCTLLSKTEVDKYCSIYIDKASESDKPNASSKDNVEEDRIAGKDTKENATKGKEVMKSPRNNKENSSKLAVLDKHKKSPPLGAKAKLAKLAKAKKLKSGLSRDCRRNQTLTGDEDRSAIDGKGTSVINCNGCVEALLPDSLSSQVTNGTQTVSIVNRSGKKRVKKRDVVVQNSQTNRKRILAGEKKRPQRDVGCNNEFESPSKIPKRSELSEHKEVEKDSAPGVKKQELVDGLVSDSNDSGFASAALSNPSTPTKTDFATVELHGLVKKGEETPKRTKRNINLKATVSTEGDSLTLSPPALLLKRLNEDSWQVEQKSPVEVEEGTNRSLNKRQGKTKKGTRAVNLTTAFDFACVEKSPKSFSAQNQVKKKRKGRKPSSGKEEVGNKPQATKDVSSIVEKGQERIEVKKLKGKQGLCKKTVLRDKETTSKDLNGFATVKEKKLLKKKVTSEKKKLDVNKQIKEDRLKQDALLQRLVKDALAKYSGSSPSNSSSSPAKTKKPKVTTAKTVLNRNKHFKLLSLFPVTSPLSLHGGMLGPSFTMSCPSGIKPTSSHPLWKWNLGGPVLTTQRSPQKFVAFKTPADRKEPQSSNLTASNKVRKLKTKRKKLSAIKKEQQVSPAKHFSSSVTNVANSDQSIAATGFENITSSTATSVISPFVKAEASCQI